MATKKAAEPKPNALAAAIDELGSIEKELAPYAAKIARAKQLKELIRQQTPDATNEVAGERFVAMFGPRGNQTVINFGALVKRIGAARFAKFATCTLKSLEENAPDAITSVTKQEATGPRHLRVLEKGVAA